MALPPPSDAVICGEDDDDLLNVPDAAQILDIADATLRKWQQNNQVPFYKIGRNIRFRRGDLREILAAAAHPAVNAR